MSTFTNCGLSLAFVAISSLNLHAIVTSFQDENFIAEKAVTCPNGAEDVTGTYKIDFIICKAGHAYCGDATPGGKPYLEQDLKDQFYCTPDEACPGDADCEEALSITYYDGSTLCTNVSVTTERASADECTDMGA
jgi:hypothetical protein